MQFKIGENRNDIEHHNLCENPCKFCQKYYKESNCNNGRHRNYNHRLESCLLLCTRIKCLNNNLHSIKECSSYNEKKFDYSEERLNVVSFLGIKFKFNNSQR